MPLSWIWQGGSRCISACWAHSWLVELPLLSELILSFEALVWSFRESHLEAPASFLRQAWPKSFACAAQHSTAERLIRVNCQELQLDAKGLRTEAVEKSQLELDEWLKWRKGRQP